MTGLAELRTRQELTSSLRLCFGQRVSASGPGLVDLHVASDQSYQRRRGGSAMTAVHGVVQRLPQPLNHVNPGVIDGLQEQFELGAVRHPPPGDGTLADDGVIHDEHGQPCPSVDALGPVQKVELFRRSDQLPVTASLWCPREEMVASDSSPQVSDESDQPGRGGPVDRDLLAKAGDSTPMAEPTTGPQSDPVEELDVLTRKSESG